MYQSTSAVAPMSLLMAIAASLDSHQITYDNVVVVLMSCNCDFGKEQVLSTTNLSKVHYILILWPCSLVQIFIIQCNIVMATGSVLAPLLKTFNTGSLQVAMLSVSSTTAVPAPDSLAQMLVQALNAQDHALLEEVMN